MDADVVPEPHAVAVTFLRPMWTYPRWPLPKPVNWQMPDGFYVTNVPEWGQYPPRWHPPRD
jgi:hypothetical protein